MNEATNRILATNDWITIILMIVVALFVYTKLVNNVRFTSLQSLIYNNNYINDYAKATPLLLNTFNTIFFIIFTLIISLIIYSFAKIFSVTLIENSSKFFLRIVLFIFLYMFVRTFIGYLLGLLFEMEKEQQYITFMKISYMAHFSLLVTPILIISIYTNSLIFTKIFLIITLVLLLFYYAKLIKNNQNFIFGRIFYFILYLCALEIAPFIIIYKMVVI